MASEAKVKLPIFSEIPFELKAFMPEEPIFEPSDDGEEGPLRTSSYVIYVDLPGESEDLLLVHGYTGAYDRISRRVATFLRSRELRRAPKPLYGDWSPEQPNAQGEVHPPSEETLTILKQRGYLTTLSQEMEQARLRRIALKLHALALRQSPSYIVMPTYDCNLRCSYCFQDHMRTDSRFAHLLRKMEPSLVDRIMVAMKQIESSHGLDTEAPLHRNVGFFGGEPLLEENLTLVEYFIGSVLKMGPASFWAVTNGTDLHAYRHLLSPQGISRLQITLDGPPSEHDRRRIYANGSGTYERIARHVDLALERGVRVNIRLNLDRNNVRDLPVLVQDFVARGWSQHPLFSTYTAAIRAENEKTDRSTIFDTWELDRTLVELGEEFPDFAVIGRPDEAIKMKARRIFSETKAQLPDYHESFCSAHDRMYIFDPFGDIYACWERTGDSKIRIGRVGEDGMAEMNGGVNNLWRGRTVASNPACSQCRYALHCGGGCAVLAVGKTGKYHANFCDGFASRFRANVAEAYMDHLAGKEIQFSTGKVCDQ